MVTLTRENYYSDENVAISNSKVSDFFKSRDYFYRKHILHEFKEAPSDAMKMGSIVDAMLSFDPIPYTPKVLKKNDPQRFEEQKLLSEDKFISQAKFDEAQKRAWAVMKTPAYQWYQDNDAQHQVVLQGELDVDGSKIPICGMADVITVTKDVVYIDDYKSSTLALIQTPKKWFYTCVDRGYFRQLAVYRHLYRLMNPDDKREIKCRHFVVAKENDHLYRTKVYNIDDTLIDAAFNEFEYGVKAIHKAIVNDSFEDAPTDWDTAETISYEDNAS